jgi:hypothetical protein
MNAVGGFRGSVRLPTRNISEMSASALSKLLVLPKVCRAVAFALAAFEHFKNRLELELLSDRALTATSRTGQF